MLSLARAKFSFVLSRFFGDPKVLSMIRSVDTVVYAFTRLHLPTLDLKPSLIFNKVFLELLLALYLAFCLQLGQFAWLSTSVFCHNLSLCLLPPRPPRRPRTCRNNPLSQLARSKTLEMEAATAFYFYGYLEGAVTGFLVTGADKHQ